MSNALAIQAVTESLKQVINFEIARQHTEFGMPALSKLVFTTKSPSQAGVGAPPGENRVNLFLFRLAPNAALRNQPMLGASGSADLARPPLPLDLHYLVSIDGTANGVEEHHLLGRVMNALHDHPILTGEDLRRFELTPPLLKPSGLADQAERVKFTLSTMDVETMFKLWAGFESKIRPAVAYEASVVLIESTRPVAPPRPVLSRGKEFPEGFESGPGRFRELLSARFAYFAPPRRAADPPVRELDAGRFGDTLTLRGRGLPPGPVALRFRHASLPDPIVGRFASLKRLQDRIEFTFAGPAVTAWPAGVYSVAVVPEPAAGVDPNAGASNEVPFSLRPTIQLAIRANPSDTVRVLEVRPTSAVRPGQSAAVLLDGPEAEPGVASANIELPAGPIHPAASAGTVPVFWAYLKGALAPQQEADLKGQVQFLRTNLRDVAPGTYLVRLRVDGADSLVFDPATESPRFVAEAKQLLPPLDVGLDVITLDDSLLLPFVPDLPL